MNTRKKSPIANLPSGVGIYPVKNGAGAKYWRVRLGKRFTQGTEQTRCFTTVQDARKWIEEQSGQKSQIAATQLTPAQLAEAKAAFDRLGTRMTLSEAIDFALAHSALGTEAKTLDEVVAAYLGAKAEKNASEGYLRAQRYACGVLQRAFGKTGINQITSTDLESFIRKQQWQPLNRKNYLRDWGMVFRFAVKREWLSRNPIDAIERPVVHHETPEIFTIAEARQLLETAESNKLKTLPFFAIGLFAGVRVEEMKRMTWEMVDLEERVIKLPGSITKTHQPRNVDIAPNLVEWLLLCPGRKGKITPVGLRERVETTFEQADIEKKRNALRHSFASYYLVQTDSADKTQLQLGQQTPSVLFKHYRQVLSRREAGLYWKIYPQNEAIIVPVSA